MRIASCIALVFAILTANVFARDIYVDNVGGNDLHDGLAPTSAIRGSGPCRTIARALRVARKGDRIILTKNDEPYRESITLQGGRHSGSANLPFEILGNGAVLDGSRPVPLDAWEHYRDDVFRFQPQRMSYQLLFLDDVPAILKHVGEDRQLPDLQPLEWTILDNYIYFRVEEGQLPANYNLTHAGLPVGITLYEVRNVIVQDLTVQGFQLDGINAHDSVFDAQLVEIVARGNGRSGVSVGGASRVHIEACLVGNNGTAQIRTEGYSHTRIVDSNLIEGEVPAVERDGGEVKIETTP